MSLIGKLEKTYVRTEERIGQCDRIYFCHRRIIDKVGINEEENRHIDRLASVESLLFEAKALNFTEIRRHLRRGDTIRSDPNDILGALVRCCIKR